MAKRKGKKAGKGGATRAQRQLAARMRKREEAQWRQLVESVEAVAQAAEAFLDGADNAEARRPGSGVPSEAMAQLPLGVRLAVALQLMALTISGTLRSAAELLSALLGGHRRLAEASELLDELMWTPTLLWKVTMADGPRAEAHAWPRCMDASVDHEVEAVLDLGTGTPAASSGCYVGWRLRTPGNHRVLLATWAVPPAAEELLARHVASFETDWLAEELPDDATPVAIPVLLELALAPEEGIGSVPRPIFDYVAYYEAVDDYDSYDDEDFYDDEVFYDDEDDEGYEGAYYDPRLHTGPPTMRPEYLADGAVPVDAPYGELLTYRQPRLGLSLSRVLGWVYGFLGYRTGYTHARYGWEPSAVRIAWPREMIAQAASREDMQPVLELVLDLLHVGMHSGEPLPMPLERRTPSDSTDELVDALLTALGTDRTGAMAAPDEALMKHPMALLCLDREVWPTELPRMAPIRAALTWSEAHPGAPEASAIEAAWQTYRAERRWLLTYDVGWGWDPDAPEEPESRVPWWDEVTHAMIALFDPRAGALPVTQLQERTGVKVSRPLGALRRAGLADDATVAALVPTDIGLRCTDGIGDVSRQAVTRAVMKHLVTWRLHEAGLSERDVVRHESRGQGSSEALAGALDELASLFETGED